MLKPIFNSFFSDITTKSFVNATAIILLCAFTTKPVLANVPISFTDVSNDIYSKEIQEAIPINANDCNYQKQNFLLR